jgi:succinoglycan biosynthesis protein ExoA
VPPFVTVAIPCYNEEEFIADCIRDVLAQDYPRDRLEIIVADGMSTDRTRAILAGLMHEVPELRVLDNPDRIQSAGLNRILGQARGDIVARLDVHAEFAPDYIRKCVEVMERTGAEVVGGAARSKARGRFQRAVCAALGSPLGVGGSKYRCAENEGFVETVFGGAFRREIFDRVGMYDPQAVTNEDAELNQRIIAGGGRVYLSREIVAYYYPRDSARGLVRQYFSYGVGRARTFVKHGRMLALRPAIPFLTVLTGLFLLLTAPFQPLTPYAFAAYAGLTLLEAIRVGRRAGLAAIPIVWAIFPMLHVAHGVGFAVGLARHLATARPRFQAARLRSRSL